MTRYARQELVFGAEGQTQLAAARVLVIGAGGLGAPVLSYLAGAGIGAIDIVDPDSVSLSNLHRQTLFSTKTLGMPKADAAKAVLTSLNPDITVRAHNTVFDPATGPRLVSEVDLVIDCADSFAASFTASDLCLAAGKPLITASVLQQAGYICGTCGGAPSLRALFPDPPDTAASCATAGVSGPVVGMIGAAQAQMALAHLTKTGDNPLGLMLTLDAATWRISHFRFDNATEPKKPLRFVAASEVRPDDLVLELRGADEAPTPITPNAVRHAPDTRLPSPPKDQRVVLACATGLRAWRMGQRLSLTWPGEIVLAAAPHTDTET
ncbi:MAG: HesA/MoeB/ThiF family protein [Dinoroseobacter sp.]|nr:HesA/MoeB/ThiF family protein [Dinoroseobacter sp.]